MEEKKRMATNMAMRCAIDATVEILGYNGAKPNFSDVGLLHLFENPPDYDWNPCITTEEYSKVFNSLADMLGINGAKGIWRRIGYLSIKIGIERGHFFDAYVSLPQNEKFNRAAELFPVASGKGKIVGNNGGLVDYDVFNCEQCKGHHNTKPICAVVEGVMQCVADWAFGKGVYRAKEIKCIAKGDDTCYYELVAVE